MQDSGPFYTARPATRNEALGGSADALVDSRAMTVLEHMKAMSPERFLSIYQSLERQGFGPLDADVAKSLRFRPQAIRKLPMEQRAKRARMLIESTKNANLAYEIVGGYLLKTCKDLVVGFLDATDVKHQDGMIEDIAGVKPASAK